MIFFKIGFFLFPIVATIILCREETGSNPSGVAWVPILARNITEVMRSVLECDTDKDEKLRRIGKMLTASYNKMIRDTEEGTLKIRQLEQKLMEKMNYVTTVHNFNLLTGLAYSFLNLL